MNEELVRLILKIAEEQNSSLPQPVATAKGADAGLYGPGSPLDSIGLVRFIVEIETAVEDRFGVSVVLADDRAMSQKHSPFRTVGSLAAYLEQLIGESAKS